MALREPTPPTRTCVGCRRRDHVSHLIRLAVVRSADSEARVVVDDRKRLPGRGAWLHRSDECLSQALRRRAFGVALRARDAVVRPEDLAETIGGIRHEGSAGSQDR